MPETVAAIPDTDGAGRAANPAANPDPAVTNALKIFCFAALALPVVAAVWFIALFSTAMPLTDEWLFLRAVIALEEIDLTSFSGLGKIIQLIPYKIYDHDVIVPFLLYWPIAELSNFDNRALLVVTLATWSIILWLFRRFIIRSDLWILPVALILFSPARYMEFLWGFQFTLALSIIFPVMALVVLSRIQPDDGTAAQLRKALGALVLIVTGTLCSAGGFFGFIGAIVLLSFQRLKQESRIFLLELIIGAMLIVYFLLMRDSGRVPTIDIRNILFILTALGSAILGMPDAFTQFALDGRSITGAAIMICMVAAVFIAARHRILPSLALPAGIFAFGLASVAAIAVARQYLGNWHLAYAVPAVCASYGACYITFRELRSAAAAQLGLSAATILMLGLIAYYTGFAEYGPRYNAYIRSIEQYARTFLENPAQAKPFPATGGWDLDARMVWFLASRRHPAFAAEEKPLLAAPRSPVPGAELVIAGNNGPENRRAHLLAVAVLPAGRRADALILRTGNADLVLRKTDPRLIAPISCPGECFTGWLPAGGLPAGAPANLSAVRLAN